ncbi:MAG: AAA family ATPase [Patescibacteria group bacterium]|nr:AAA family ATPase [Patescibacteria group bacterium]
MILLREISLKGITEENTFPFNLPLIKSFEKLVFDSPVTFFVGENGSGKSTLLEGAAATQLPAIGSDNAGNDETLKPARKLAESLKLVWSIKTHQGFFLRAEDFFGFIKKLTENKRELEATKTDFANRFQGYGKMLAVGSIEGQLKGLTRKYGQDLDANSHGESFLKLFQSRLVPNGLYLLDEPETPLSPLRQLSLISLIKEMIEKDCQFIIATHSPILMAFPNATIYNFDQLPLAKVAYQNLDHVKLTKAFLDNPEEFLRRL